MTLRIVYWNIRAGGGRRAEGIAEQIARWNPDVVGLGEFRGTPASVELSAMLAEQGMKFQLDEVDRKRPAVNSVMLAARRPIKRVGLHRRPDEPCRWLMARLDGGLSIGVLHAPNYVTGRKQAFFSSVMDVARRWRGGPAIFGGDTNTGVPPLDGNPNAFHPFEMQWIPELERRGWIDAYRHLNGQCETFTWYSPNAGNGYRLDQAFVNRSALPTLRQVQHQWGVVPGIDGPRHILSDHAALILDFG